jgi:hypothetical protein
MSSAITRTASGRTVNPKKVFAALAEIQADPKKFGVSDEGMAELEKLVEALKPLEEGGKSEDAADTTDKTASVAGNLALVAGGISLLAATVKCVRTYASKSPKFKKLLDSTLEKTAGLAYTALCIGTAAALCALAPDHPIAKHAKEFDEAANTAQLDLPFMRKMQDKTTHIVNSTNDDDVNTSLGFISKWLAKAKLAKNNMCISGDVLAQSLNMHHALQDLHTAFSGKLDTSSTEKPSKDDEESSGKEPATEEGGHRTYEEYREDKKQRGGPVMEKDQWEARFKGKVGSLRSATIRVAYSNPDLRPHLLSVLKEARVFPSEKALQTYLKQHPKADRSRHSVDEKVRNTKHDDFETTQKKPTETESKQPSKKQEGAPADKAPAQDKAKGDGGSKAQAPKKSWKDTFSTFLQSAKGIPATMGKALKSAGKEVQQIVVDPEYRRDALYKMGETIKKSPGKVSKQIHKAAKKEMKELKHAAHALGKVLRKPPHKWTSEDKHAVYAAAVYVAGAAIAGSTGGALAAAGILGQSFAKHVAIKALHDILDKGFLHFEAGEAGVHGIGHIIEHLSHVAGDEEGEVSEDPALEKKLIDYLTVAVGHVLAKGISNEEMQKILKDEHADFDPDSLPDPKKAKAKKKGSLRTATIRAAHADPELRPFLLPLLQES